jgi:four helix bundle protein
MSVEKQNKAPGNSFTALEVWKKMRGLKIEVERIVKTFPSEEKYRLAHQLIRSVRSVNANIAEGHGRYTFRDQVNFCVIARGSLSEPLNHLIDAFDCRYISGETLKDLKAKITEVEKLLNGYINWLRRNSDK